MPSLSGLARQARLAKQDVEWLHALVSDWQLLADLSFADLVLWAELPDGGWIALAQMRPTTGPTSFPDDIVGSHRPPGEPAVPGRGQAGPADLPGGRPGVEPGRPGPARDDPGGAATAT